MLLSIFWTSFRCGGCFVWGNTQLNLGLIPGTGLKEIIPGVLFRPWDQAGLSVYKSKHPTSYISTFNFLFFKIFLSIPLLLGTVFHLFSIVHKFVIESNDFLKY